ncbi:MAG: porin family protein [Bdellovibrionales bacterium]|nr:porin family protein [Bdellovibrionales bacterium]
MKIFLIVMFFSLNSFASSYYVAKPKSKGTTPATIEAVFELFKSSIAGSNDHSLSNSPGASDYTVQPKILQMGGTVLVIADKIQNNKVIFSTRMKSEDLSDLDTVVNRLFASLEKEENIKTTAKVNNVTEAEEYQSTRRFQATNQWQFAFGPAWGNKLNTSKAGTFFGFGYIWGLDPHFDLKLNLSILNPDDSEDSAYFRSTMLGMNYFFDLNKHSPFITGSVGYISAAADDGSDGSIINDSDDDASGWGVDVGIGYKFFRTSSVNIATSINYSYLFEKTKFSQENPGLTRFIISVYF